MPDLGPILQVAAFLVVGGILLFIECITPGFTLPGTLGLTLVGVACYLAFRHLSVTAGVITVIGSAALIFYLLRYFPRSPLGRRMSLRLTQRKDEGYHAGAVRTVRVGDAGEALTTLRPSGTARINGQRIDVITEGGFVAEGARVAVVQVDGMRVVVREQRGGA